MTQEQQPSLVHDAVYGPETTPDVAFLELTKEITQLETRINGLKSDITSLVGRIAEIDKRIDEARLQPLRWRARLEDLKNEIIELNSYCLRVEGEIQYSGFKAFAADNPPECARYLASKKERNRKIDQAHKLLNTIENSAVTVASEQLPHKQEKAKVLGVLLELSHVYDELNTEAEVKLREVVHDNGPNMHISWGHKSSVELFRDLGIPFMSIHRAKVQIEEELAEA